MIKTHLILVCEPLEAIGRPHFRRLYAVFREYDDDGELITNYERRIHGVAVVAQSTLETGAGESDWYGYTDLTFHGESRLLGIREINRAHKALTSIERKLERIRDHEGIPRTLAQFLHQLAAAGRASIAVETAHSAPIVLDPAALHGLATPRAWFDFIYNTQGQSLSRRAA